MKEHTLYCVWFGGLELIIINSRVFRCGPRCREPQQQLWRTGNRYSNQLTTCADTQSHTHSHKTFWVYVAVDLKCSLSIVELMWPSLQRNSTTALENNCKKQIIITQSTYCEHMCTLIYTQTHTQLHIPHQITFHTVKAI